MDYLKNMAKESPTWIFAFGGSLPQTAIISLRERLALWTAHGAPVHGSVELIADRFILVGADIAIGATPTGCSIDWLQKTIDSWCHDHNIHRYIAGTLFYTSKNGKVTGFDRAEIDSLRNNGEITDDTVVYDLALSTLKDIRERFMLPYKDSWYKKL